MGEIADHILEYLVRHDLSAKEYYKGLPGLAGVIIPDLEFLMTDLFDFEESHDVEKARQFVEWTDQNSHDDLEFAKGKLEHVESDIGQHNNPLFKGYVTELGRKIAKKYPESDQKIMEIIAHLGLEWSESLRNIRDNPQLPRIARKAVIDIDEYADIIGEFYDKDSNRLRKQLSVASNFKPDFFSDPVVFAKTLLTNYKEIKGVKDEGINNVYDYLLKREDYLEQDIRLILYKVDKFLSYKSLLSRIFSYRQRGSHLFSPIENYQKL